MSGCKHVADFSDASRYVKIGKPAWILLVVFLLLARPTNAQESFIHHFGAATKTEPGLDFSFDQNGVASKVTKTGIAIENKQNDTTMASVGGKTRFGFRGDGTIRMEFSVDKMTAPDQGWGSGVQLRLEFCDRARSGVTVSLIAATDGVIYWQIDYTTGGQDKHDVRRVPAFTDVFEATQVIEVTRRGKLLTVLRGAKGQLIPLDEQKVSTTDIYPVAVWIGSGGGKADLAVELESLEIEAEQLASDSAIPPATSSWRILFWCFVAVAGIAFGFYLRQQWQMGI
ncbi:hypothetical protein [Planctomycetes bacterium CA13]